MAVRQFTFTPGNVKEDVRATSTATATAVAGGAANLGGTVGMVLLIDDAVVTSRSLANIAIELFEQIVTAEGTWPPS